MRLTEEEFIALQARQRDKIKVSGCRTATKPFGEFSGNSSVRSSTTGTGKGKNTEAGTGTGSGFLSSMSPKKPRDLEHQEQVQLFRHIEEVSAIIPGLKVLEWLFAIPNGGKRPKGEAGRMKAEGAKSGVPDLFLPIPRGEHHGLFIEMKVEGRKPTKNQERWIDRLRENGYQVEICYSWQEAWNRIMEYVGEERFVFRTVGKKSTEGKSTEGKGT